MITMTDMHVPHSADADDAADFRRVIEIGNIVAVEDAGTSDFVHPADELLPQWHDETDRHIHTILARDGDGIVGAATYTVATAPDTVTLQVDVMVPRTHWATGAAAALLASTEEAARQRGLTTIQVWTLHPVADGATFTPKTGWGTAPVTPLSDLLNTSGFTLEQVERTSALTLDGDFSLVTRMLRDATAFAGSDYESVAWTLPTPAEYRDGYASIMARLDTDAPSGDLTVDPEVWDADRVIRRDSQFAQAGQTVSVAGIIHRPTGTLVAYNELVIGRESSAVTHQYGTLVMKEHRGHRLGTMVKCANLLRWRDISPDSPRVVTFNAEENRPMLSINEAIGFVPVSYAGGWQKSLRDGVSSVR